MARVTLPLVMLASIMCILSPAEAQTGVRAVNFTRTGCVHSNNLQAQSPFSSSGEISVWYGFQTIGPGDQQTLVTSNTNGAGATNVLDLHIENDVGMTGLSNGSHLFLLTTDGTQSGIGQQYSQWVSDEVLPATGWHHIYITWDTSQTFSDGNYLAVAFLDGIELTPNATYTHGNTTAQNYFSTPYFYNNLNNAWQVGCYLNPVTAQFSSFVDGDIAEVYAGPLGSATFPDIAPFGEFKPVTAGWGPKELGNFCLAPHPGDGPPVLCLRGGSSTFRLNLYPSTAEQLAVNPGGTAPATATDDPFLAIR